VLDSVVANAQFFVPNTSTQSSTHQHINTLDAFVKSSTQSPTHQHSHQHINASTHYYQQIITLIDTPDQPVAHQHQHNRQHIFSNVNSKQLQTEI
jgi:hypothetical protein